MKLILYFADGFAYQYFAERPFMDGFWNEQRPLQTLLGYSSTIMPCILTGRMPQDTGIWTEYYLDPGPRSRLQRLLTRRRLRWALTPVDLVRLVYFRFARKLGWGAEHRLRIPFVLSHLFARHPLHYDQFPPIGLDARTLADVFRERGLEVSFRYIRDGLNVEDELAHLDEAAESTDVFFYYDPSMDSRGHQLGASSADDVLGPTMDELAAFLKAAWERLDAEYDPEMLLFSDHGMTTVTGTFDLLGALSGYHLGSDYLAFIDSTMARFWFPSDEARRAIKQRLSGGPVRFLSQSDLIRHGIAFEDERYGQEVLVANEGTVLHPNYFAGPFTRFARSYPELAMHGYLPDAPSSVGVFCYRGARWSSSSETLVVTDIFDVVLDILSCRSLAS